jgi:seipin
MAESEKFEKGRSNVPEYVLIEIQAGQGVQIYDVRVHFTARFRGLRWMMYNHRIISFMTFTSAFWVAELLFTVLGWVMLRSIFSTGSGKNIKKESGLKAEGKDGETSAAIKNEPEDTDEPDLSDTPRTFPTYGRQKPLRYEPKAKDEDSEEYIMDETVIQPLTAEADDEDDNGVGYDGRGDDSGLGTSFSEGGVRGMARRRSRGGRGEG